MDDYDLLRVPPGLIDRHIARLAFWKRRGYMSMEQIEELRKMMADDGPRKKGEGDAD